MTTRDTLLTARQSAENSIEFYQNTIREREEEGAVSNNPWSEAYNNQDLEREIAVRQNRIAEIDRRLSELNESNTLQQTDPSYGTSRIAEIERSRLNEQITQGSEFAERDAEPVTIPQDEQRLGADEVSELDPSVASSIGLGGGAPPSVRGIGPQLETAETVQSRRAERLGESDTDWRVKLSLAPQANYLYKAPEPGILEPLKSTNGVIFPYTPQIDTVYYANYNNEDLTHSNYRAYFYQNSYPGEILMQATFTAQTSQEADYLLAVIHFFRSATKMFYGQDEQRGTPPPVLYLDGLGEYQYNLHPCLITQFNYNLPNDVDYIRAGSPSRFNQPQGNEPAQETSFWAKTAASLLEQFDGTAARLAASALRPGAPAEALSTSPEQISDFVARNRISGTFQRPTYVPSEIGVSLTLLPIQSRKQVSEQFSLKDFASGKLLKRGFW